MKKKHLFPGIGGAAAASLFCAGLGLVCAPLAVAQPDCPTPYAFTTLVLKTGPDNAVAATGGTKYPDLKGIAVDAAGNIYGANSRDHTICRIAPTGEVSILAGQSGSSGSEDGPAATARFRFPQGVAVDAAGNIYVADGGNNTIRRITPAGAVTTLAGQARQVGSADGAGGHARFNYPKGVALDSAGNIYVADLFNATIRKVTPAGTVTTLAGLAGESGTANGIGSAARFNCPVSVIVDAADNVYVADMLNNAIRKITATGMVTTLAGQMSYDIGSADGPGTVARFSHPGGLSVDGAANLYITDTDNQTIRRINSAGDVTTRAGRSGQAGSADGFGRDARFYHPAGIVMDQAGNLYVSRLGDFVIRKGVPVAVALTPAASPQNLSFSLNTP